MAELVGGAVGEAGLDAAAGQPHREAAGVVVAAGAVLLGVRRAAELAAPPDQRVFEQAALLEVGQQPGDRLVHGAGVVGMLGHVRVLVPRRVGGVVAVGHLDVAHARLAEPAGHQALPAEGVGGLLADAVQASVSGDSFDRSRTSGRVALHPPGQLVGVDRPPPVPRRRGSFSCSAFSSRKQVELPLCSAGDSAGLARLRMVASFAGGPPVPTAVPW